MVGIHMDHRWVLKFSKKGLSGIYWNPEATEPNPIQDHLININHETKNQLIEYFEGKRKIFSIPIDLQGTRFQLKVWNELIKIPYGTTTTYLEIAKRIGNPKAVRAVGTAIGKNPICIIIPCHRVISSDGSIGGYSGGVDNKKKLIYLESTVEG